MTEKQLNENTTEVRNFLGGYQVCLDMLKLQRYERKRKKPFDEEVDCSDLAGGDEAYLRARMYEVETLIGSMRPGREKLVLYYHYIKGMRIERVATVLGFSRRTAYRAHQSGLCRVALLYEHAKREGLLFEED